MASNLTWYTELQEPTINADINVWGAILNSTNGAWGRALAGYSTASLAGGDWTPTTSDSEMLVLKPSGILTGNRSIVVPNKNRRYIVWNTCTGAFTVTIKTTAGTGVVCPQGELTLVYTDFIGTDVTYKVGPSLGTMAAQNANAVAITGGNINGLTSLGATGSGPFTLTYVDAGAAVGPTGIWYRNSSSPAAADVLGSITYRGKDSGGNDTDYAHIRAIIDDPTDGSEDGNIVFRTTIAGSAGDRVHVGAGLYSDGVTGGDKGAGSANFTTIYQANVALGTAAFVPTGTSGATVPLLNGNNTYSGTSSFTAAVTITLADTSVGLTVRSSDAGAAAAPPLRLLRTSASPAANDLLGSVQFAGNNSTPASITYTSIGATIGDPTAASEDATQDFYTIVAGSLAARLHIGAGTYSEGTTGGDKGAGTANFTTIYQNNVALSAAATTAIGTSGATIPLLNGNNTYSGTAAFTGAVTISGSQVPLTVSWNDAGAGYGPYTIWLRDSATPAAADGIGAFSFRGNDSGGNVTEYAAVLASIVDPTNGSEDGAVQFATIVAGVSAARMTVGAGMYMAALTDQGAGTVNATRLYVSGGVIVRAIQVITASGTYTPTAGAVSALVELVGGGGGGGGADATSGSGNAGGAGGGGGGYSRKLIVISGTYGVTIGAAGTAGTNAGGNGGAGGTTTFGTGPLLQATGGAGGDGSIGGTTAGVVNGGAGGIGSLGDFNSTGSGGGPGLVLASVGQSGGAGGSSTFGGGGTTTARATSGSTAGNAGGVYGGAGGGATCNTTTSGAAGGAGAAGVVIVTEYFS